MCLFIILSSYVLTFRFFKCYSYELIISGAFRRYFRLLPLVLLSIILGFLLSYYSLFFNKYIGLYSGDGTGSYFFTAEPKIPDLLLSAFITSFTTGFSPYNLISGSIRWLFIGAMIAYCITFFFGRIRWRYIIYAVAIILLINTVYATSVLGLLLSDMKNSKSNLFKPLQNSIILFLLLIMGLFLGSYPVSLNAIESSIYKPLMIPINNPPNLYYTLGSFFILFALVNSDLLQKLLTFRVFTFLGQISYPLFLFHFIALCSFSSFIFLKLINLYPYNFTGFITLIVSLIVVILMSYLLYISVDINSNRLSKKLYEFVKKFIFVLILHKHASLQLKS